MASRIEEASLWLQELLRAGPVAAKTVCKEALAAGLVWPTVRRAGDARGVVSTRIGGLTARGKWQWALPGPKPEPAAVPDPGAPMVLNISGAEHLSTEPQNPPVSSRTGTNK